MIWEVDEDCDGEVSMAEFAAMWARCREDKAGGCVRACVRAPFTTHIPAPCRDSAQQHPPRRPRSQAPSRASCTTSPSLWCTTHAAPAW